MSPAQDQCYRQQALFGSETVGFRNSDGEPWQKYRTPSNGAVLNFATNGDGYCPAPDWVRVP